MKWIEVVISTTEEASDAITDMLTSIGAGGVAINDPNDIRREIEKPNTLDYADEDFINSLGDEVIIKAYFPDQVNCSELFSLIKEKLLFISSFLDIGKGFSGYTEVDDEDWSTAWKKYYKPFHISDRVVIKPSWEDYTAGENDIIIEMDPGMAFGTGTHETTRMCAQLLEQYFKKGDSILDVGCGTGILSIIAAKLGASRAVAVDVDEVAVRITSQNSSLNNVENAVKAQTGQLDDVKKEKFDVVIANIIANVIVDISEAITYYLKAGGCFITSGIIRERRDEVIKAYMKQGFEKVNELQDGEWVAMVFKCQDSL